MKAAVLTWVSALAAALRALDGRGQATALIPLLEKHAGCPLSEWVSSIYAGDAKGLIASAAPLLLQAAESGDSVARTELNASAAGMAQAIMCAVDRCPVQSVVLGGSVWKSRLYTETVRKHLRDGITLLYPSVPPVLGAVLQAAETADIPAGKDFQDNLRQGLT